MVMSISLVGVIFSSKLVFEIVAKVGNVYLLNSLIGATIQDDDKRERSNGYNALELLNFILMLF